jgi:hypothetical protein
MSTEPDPPPADVPVDPYGPDPEGIPDPMPDELQEGAATEERVADEEIEPMEGPAPSG